MPWAPMWFASVVNRHKRFAASVPSWGPTSSLETSVSGKQMKLASVAATHSAAIVWYSASSLMQ